MHGEPVWLVSLSKLKAGTEQFDYVPEWSAATFNAALDLFEAAMDGAGDPTRQRVFRMNVTLCLHRQLNDSEIARLPAQFWTEGATGMAGGPVEIISETMPGLASTRPCVNPTKRQLPASHNRTYGWIPVDCGECRPCRARASIEAT